MDVWGNLLVDYGKGLDSIDSGLDKAAENLGPIGGAPIQRFKSLLNDVLSKIGLEPTDMKTYKPTLVQAVKILDAESDFDIGEINEKFQQIPTSEYEFLHFTLSEFGIEIDDGKIKICDIEIPFLKDPISIEVPIGSL